MINKGRREKKKSLKILIVDDKPVFRRGLRDMLYSQFHESVEMDEASHGKEFLEKIDTFQPGIVLMEVEMSGMSGIEAAIQAKVMHPEVRIFGMSTFDDPNYIDSMKNAGAEGFLSKNEDLAPRLRMIINDAFKNKNTEVKEKNSIRIDTLISELVIRCPFHSDITNCALLNIRKKPMDEQYKWLRGLSKVEKLNVVLHHKRCLINRQHNFYSNRNQQEEQ